MSAFHGFDAIGVVAGVSVGLAVAVISKLLLGADATVIGGSLLASSLVASTITGRRARK
jgi:hypothetical protein